MNKYYRIYSEDDVDEVMIGSTNDLDEAFKIARDAWDSMTPHDKRRNTVRVLHFCYDVDDEDCTCFDYDTYEWFRKYSAYKGIDDVEPLETFDWYEAYDAVSDYSEGFIEAEDYRTGCCLEAWDVQDLREYMEIY